MTSYTCLQAGGWQPWLGHKGKQFLMTKVFAKSVVSESFEGLKNSFHLGKVSKAKKAWVKCTKVETTLSNWNFSNEFEVDGSHTGYQEMQIELRCLL